MTIEVTISMDKREPYTLKVSHRKHYRDKTEVTEPEFLKSGINVVKCIEDNELLFIEVVERCGIIYGPTITIEVSSDSENGVIVAYYDENVNEVKKVTEIEDYLIGATIPGGKFDCALYENENTSRCVMIQQIHNRFIKKFTEKQDADRYKDVHSEFKRLHR